MKWVEEGCILKDVHPEWMMEETKKRDPDFKGFNQGTCERCVAVWFMGVLAGFFLTINYKGFRSFHGYKFYKGQLSRQIKLANSYMNKENLEYSAFSSRKTEAILKVLGFKVIFEMNGVKLARRENGNQSKVG